MQLAILWSLHHRQRRSLPTQVEAFVPFGAPATGPLRCDLQVRRAGRHEVVADLQLHEAQGGRPVAELRGLTMTLLEPNDHEVTA
jgi:hypothetical protein